MQKCHRVFMNNAGTRRVDGRFYRRQSALRTIKGGIWAGLGLRRLLLTQLRLLGYQRIVKGCGLNVSPFFFSLPNITVISATLRCDF
jgi:hypothetical protein